MAEVRRKAPHSTKVIEKWVNDYAREQGVAVNRVQRWIWPRINRPWLFRSRARLELTT